MAIGSYAKQRRRRRGPDVRSSPQKRRWDHGPTASIADIRSLDDHLQCVTNPDPVKTQSGVESCFDLIRQARPAARPFNQSLFRANAKPYAPFNCAQRGSEAILS